MNVTNAHKDTLKYLKGYPIAIEPGDILFSLDTGTLGIDAYGNRLYPKNDVTTIYFGEGPFNQGATIIETAARNLIDDSVFDDISNWNSNPTGVKMEEDKYKPWQFSGGIENSFCINNGSQQSLSLKSNNFINNSYISAGSNIIQSCWIKTDANAVRFIYESSTTGQHIDDYVTIASEKWQHIEAANYYEVVADDLSGQITQFFLETSSNATYLYVFMPQTEINTFSTSWTKTERAEGSLVYSNSYFLPSEFTLSLWFKLKHYPADYAAILSICDSDSPFQRLLIRVDNDQKLYFFGSNEDIEIFNVNSSQYIDKKWNHVAITYDSKKYIFFLNGSRITDIEDTRHLEFDKNASLFLGTHNNHNVINGFISDVLISNRAFDPLNIRYIYEGSQPLFNPMAYMGQV